MLGLGLHVQLGLGLRVRVQGETDDELAASLVDEMIRTGLTARA